MTKPVLCVHDELSLRQLCLNYLLFFITSYFKQDENMSVNHNMSLSLNCIRLSYIMTLKHNFMGVMRYAYP